MTPLVQVVEETYDPPDTGRGMDPELRAISAILRILRDQDEKVAARIVGYIRDRFCDVEK